MFLLEKIILPSLVLIIPIIALCHTEFLFWLPNCVRTLASLNFCPPSLSDFCYFSNSRCFIVFVPAYILKIDNILVSFALANIHLFKKNIVLYGIACNSPCTYIKYLHRGRQQLGRFRSVRNRSDLLDIVFY